MLIAGHLARRGIPGGCAGWSMRFLQASEV